MEKYIFGRWAALLGLLLTIACMTTHIPNQSHTHFDWQGHRGARGLAPENTIAGFLLALDFAELNTLELDLAVSADGQLVVSHEPWFSAEICSHPDGRPVLESEEENLLIFSYPYEQIRAFDCGKRAHPRFPQQQAALASKPLLADVVAQADQYARQKGRALPYYNIEIKSTPEWDGLRTPPVNEFARLVVSYLQLAGIETRTCIQSFDVRALQAMRALAPSTRLALLVENRLSLDENLALLGFTPQIYSPNHQLVDTQLVQGVHQRAMQLIPWTVNEPTDMQRLISLGVDGIITDYPNRIIPHSTVQAIREAAAR